MKILSTKSGKQKRRKLTKKKPMKKVRKIVLPTESPKVPRTNFDEIARREEVLLHRIVRSAGNSSCGIQTPMRQLAEESYTPFIKRFSIAIH